MTIETLRKQFPQLEENVYGKPLVYLDNAATSLRPMSVISKWNDVSLRKNANIHRSVHYFSSLATEEFENTRSKVAAFIGAKTPREIVFTSGATASLNLIASSLGEFVLEKGSEVIILESEHHSNIVPWQIECKKKGASIKVLGVDEYGCFSLDELKDLITPKTRIVTLAHASNVLGLVNPVKEVVNICHQRGVYVVVDGSQAIAHTKVDVKDLGVDFYVFSGHKMYAATGTGVLFGRFEILEKMPPYMSGGEMIETVKWSGTTFSTPPAKFEAGTQNISSVPTLSAAIEVMSCMQNQEIKQELDEVCKYLLEELPKIDGLRLFGVPRGTFTKLPIFSFAIRGVHHEDLAILLDKMGIEVRSGQMCAEPLMARFGVTGMVRASFAPYNTLSEAQYFVSSLYRAVYMLK